jgi:hypothetical protein
MVGTPDPDGDGLISTKENAIPGNQEWRFSFGVGELSETARQIGLDVFN